MTNNKIIILKVDLIFKYFDNKILLMQIKYKPINISALC